MSKLKQKTEKENNYRGHFSNIQYQFQKKKATKQVQAWCLNSPFLIYLIIITCFCQFIKWFTIQYYHLLLAPYLFPKVSSKTNQKTEMPEVKDPFISTVSHHWKRKIAYTCCERSKVFKKAFFYQAKAGSTW